MKIKKSFVIRGAIVLGCIALAALVYSVYTETRFDIPNAFGDLASFADESVLAWAEARSLTEARTAFQKDPVGKTLSESALFRDSVLEPMQDQARYFTRRLVQLTGLDIGEAVLARAFELPAAIGIYAINESNTMPVCILKVRAGDSLVTGLAAKLGAALSGDNELTETKWKEKSIFALGEAPRTIYFALVNDALLVSPEMDLVKLSIRSASRKDARALPPEWKDFLARHPFGEGVLARFWIRQEYCREAFPGIPLIIPGAARAASLAASVTVNPGLALEASWNPADAAAVISENMLRQLPASGLAMQADANFAMGETWLGSGLFARALAELPKDIRSNLEKFLKTLAGNFALVFEGVLGDGSAVWPSLRFIADAGKANEQAFAKLETLIADIPGAKISPASHHGLEYKTLLHTDNPYTQEGKTPAPKRIGGFNPCYARIGDLIVLALDEKSMQSAIELSQGLQPQILDTTFFTQSLDKVRRESLTHYAVLDAKKIIANIYPQMEAYGFRSGDYSQRELAGAFRPLLNDGLGFNTLSVIAAREQNHIRARLTPR
ncbi:MAG: hypothetical protein LBC99_02135 [Spirochaetota bacterium]|jgi:hypothetical protein|nr:hypothetical protein [Spirochaetota bacterium]